MKTEFTETIDTRIFRVVTFHFIGTYDHETFCGTYLLIRKFFDSF